MENMLDGSQEIDSALLQGGGRVNQYCIVFFVTIREVMMGEGNGVASVIMLTFTKMPGPHADTAWAVVG